jgi:DNA polymerase III delta prime subunit
LTEFVKQTRKYPLVKTWVWMDDADTLLPISQQALRRILEVYEPLRAIFVCRSESGTVH